MPTNHWKNVPIPSVGDDLLGAWPSMLDAAGIVTLADSVAAARVMLTAAESGGHPPTPAHPFLTLIGGNLWWADGTKSADGVWVLRPVNELEVDDQTYTGTWGGSLAPGQFTGMATSALLVRPYARLATVTAGAYVASLSGNVDLCILCQGRMRLVRVDSADAASYAGSLQAVIPAGVAPQISMGLRGGSGGGSVSLSRDSRFNYLTVQAVPAPML